MSAEEQASGASEAEAADAISIHERQRAAILARLPGWYSPVAHLALPSAFGLACLIFAAAHIHVGFGLPVEDAQMLIEATLEVVLSEHPLACD